MSTHTHIHAYTHTRAYTYTPTQSHIRWHGRHTPSKHLCIHTPTHSHAHVGTAVTSFGNTRDFFVIQDGPTRNALQVVRAQLQIQSLGFKARITLGSLLVIYISYICELYYTYLSKSTHPFSQYTYVYHIVTIIFITSTLMLEIRKNSRNPMSVHLDMRQSCFSPSLHTHEQISKILKSMNPSLQLRTYMTYSSHQHV